MYINNVFNQSNNFYCIASFIQFSAVQSTLPLTDKPMMNQTSVEWNKKAKTSDEYETNACQTKKRSKCNKIDIKDIKTVIIVK